MYFLRSYHRSQPGGHSSEGADEVPALLVGADRQTKQEFSIPWSHFLIKAMKENAAEQRDSDIDAVLGDQGRPLQGGQLGRSMKAVREQEWVLGGRNSMCKGPGAGDVLIVPSHP